MKRYRYGVLTLLAAGLIACGGPAAAVAYDQVCDPANDHKSLSTEGYFAVAGSVFCSNIGSSSVKCGLEFVKNAGDSDGFTADVIRGDGDNEVEEIPDDFTAESITIHADDGSIVRVGDKVRISGEMLISENVCLMSVDYIMPIK